MATVDEISREPQARASDPAASAWVSANAGSGKTHVLVNRVVRLLLNGVAPQRVLCLTYTRAAAAEMSRRLFDELASWIAMADEDLLKRIHEHTGHVTYRDDQLAQARQLFARALETPGGLKVQTIHAFCERLLQRFPVEAGMVPGFQVMDDLTGAEVLGQARATVLATVKSEPGGATAQALARIVGLTSADRFDELLQDLLGHRDALIPMLHGQRALERRLDALRQALGLQGDETTASVLSEALAGIDQAAYRAAMASSVITKLTRDNINLMLAADDPSARFTHWQAVLLKKDGDLRNHSNLLKRNAETAEPDLCRFLCDEQERVARATDRIKACETLEATGALMLVGLQIVAAFEAEKRRRGLADYDDLIDKTRALLEVSGASQWVLYKLDGGLDHVLIDEAQDTSPQQWSIVAKLTEEFFAGAGADDHGARTVFAVGDYKQSIYSFQGADPAEFARMQRYFRDKISGAGMRLAEVPLLASFRSTPEVLQTVDRVFDHPAAEIGLKDMSDDVLVHTPRRVGQAGLVELWPLEVKEDAGPEQFWQAPRRIDAGGHPRLRLARKIADTIRHWVDSGETLTPRGRPVRYSDILILVRRRTTFMDALVRSLKLVDIPVAGADRLELTRHIAVQDLLALARFVLLPEDDLTLASVLKSPLVARDDGDPFAEDDLFALAHDRGKATLWQRLAQSVAAGAPYAAARRALERWRTRVGFVTPYQFFAEVLIADGGRSALMRRLGAEAADPIDAFLAEALNFQTRHTPSLHDFLGWLEGADVQIKRDMDHSANEVRIMTVHGAKGLEANVVILPDTTDVPDMRKAPAVLFMNGDGGDTLPIWRLRVAQQPALTRQLAAAHLHRQMEEYYRLLYVAMTRARDRLYVCGYNDKPEAPPESWYGLISRVLACPDHMTGDGVWRIDGKQTAKCDEDGDDGGLMVEPAAAPAWAHSPPSTEPTALHWFAPSKLAPVSAVEQVGTGERVDPPFGADQGRFQRGNLIHKLLQILPDVPPGERQAAGRRYLERRGGDDDSDVLAEVMAVLDDPAFAPVFAPGSRAEVPVAARLDLGGSAIGLTGQIDRLVVTDDEVLIVDYKTNRPAPAHIEAADAAYVRQLAAYRAALVKLYPHKTVRAALLWTNTAHLMEVPATLLDQALS